MKNTKDPIKPKIHQLVKLLISILKTQMTQPRPNLVIKLVVKNVKTPLLMVVKNV